MSTIDERLAALVQSVELLSVNVHTMQDNMREMRERQARLDARERQARQAILSGIAAYFKALEAPEEPDAEA